MGVVNFTTYSRGLSFSCLSLSLLWTTLAGAETTAAAQEASKAVASSEELASETSSDDENVELDPERLEVSGTPIIGYDSNTGIDLGALLNIAQFTPQTFPYDYRLNLLLHISVKQSPDGVTVPLQEHYLDYEKVGLSSPFDAQSEMRMKTRIGYFRNAQTGYYGIGAGAELDPALIEKRFNHYFYDSIEPFAWTQLRITLLHFNTETDNAKPQQNTAGQDLEFFTRLDTRVHLTRVYEGSELAEDLESSDPDTQKLLLGVSDHFKAESTAGFAFDTRDHEIDPNSGMLHDASVRAGFTTIDQGAYYGLNMTARFFVPLMRRFWTLAFRGVADYLGGAPPFYELSQRGGLRTGIATGGAQSLRGVLARRYHGKLKLLGNVETRFRFSPFQAWGQQFAFGTVGFFDAGRVWANGFTASDLDDDGRVSTGVGGGGRFFWGESFIFRGDFAFSPSDNTNALYITIDQAF